VRWHKRRMWWWANCLNPWRLIGDDGRILATVYKFLGDWRCVPWWDGSGAGSKWFTCELAMREAERLSLVKGRVEKLSK